MRQYTTLFLIAACLTLAGCGGGWFSETIADLPADERSQYQLVERRCSQCHGMEKLQKMYRRSTERLDWELEVDDMSRREGSRIRPDEQELLTDLLYRWSQGADR